MKSSADPRPRVWLHGVAWEWRGLRRARRAFGAPVAVLDGASRPSRVVTLKRTRHLEPVPSGPPRPADNVWACYPGRRWVVTAMAGGHLVTDAGGSPAWWIAEMLTMTVEENEVFPDGLKSPVPPGRRVPLVVDGVLCGLGDWYEDGGLHCRAGLAGDVWFAVICPAGQEGDVRLVTR